MAPREDPEADLGVFGDDPLIPAADLVEDRPADEAIVPAKMIAFRRARLTMPTLKK